MEIGSGKYKIKPLVYYKKSLLAFTRPQWFYKEFFPKIPVEITYTMMEVTAAISALLTYFVNVIGGGGILSILPIAIGAVFSMALGAAITFVFFYVASMVTNPLSKQNKDLWKLSCFCMTINGLIVSFQYGSGLGLLMSFAFLIVSLVFSYHLTVHFFRVSKTVAMVVLVGSAVVALVAGVGVILFAKAMMSGVGELSSSQPDAKELMQEIQKLQILK